LLPPDLGCDAVLDRRTFLCRASLVIRQEIADALVRATRCLDKWVLIGNGVRSTCAPASAGAMGSAEK
jgi:hypothetical protein